MASTYLLESFRFEDENDYDYEIWLNVLSRILKKCTLQKATLSFWFTIKVSTVIFIKEIKPSPDRKMIKLLTFDNLFPPLRHSR